MKIRNGTKKAPHGLSHIPRCRGHGSRERISKVDDGRFKLDMPAGFFSRFDPERLSLACVSAKQNASCNL